MTGIVAAHRRVVGDLRHAGQRAEPQPLRVRLRSRPSSRRQGVDVEHPRRPQHVELHQVEQRGAAGQSMVGTGAAGGGGLRHAALHRGLVGTRS